MSQTVPVLRIFDVSKAKEFYLDWLGFQIDWQSNSGQSPQYFGISLNDIHLHLSEHHGDGTPGSKVLIEDFPNLKSYHNSLQAKNYDYMNPGLEVFPHAADTLSMEVVDPFGNHMVFTGPK